jgi:hypothetical protein
MMPNIEEVRHLFHTEEPILRKYIRTTNNAIPAPNASITTSDKSGVRPG